MELIQWSDFEKVDMRIGTIIKVEDFPEAIKPAYKLTIDFGPEIGVKVSSAQITALYTKKKLKNVQVMAVVNFPPKKIGPFVSECLIMGAYNATGDVVLLQPQREIYNGAKVG